MTRPASGIGERWVWPGLLVAAGGLMALGIAWWGDRAHPFETPVWDATRFVELSPARGEPDERWIVAVSLGCPHCVQHLRSLAAHLAHRRHAPALAALIVDQPARPRGFDLGVPLAGGRGGTAPRSGADPGAGVSTARRSVSIRAAGSSPPRRPA